MKAEIVREYIERNGIRKPQGTIIEITASSPEGTRKMTIRFPAEDDAAAEELCNAINHVDVLRYRALREHVAKVDDFHITKRMTSGEPDKVIGQGCNLRLISHERQTLNAAWLDSWVDEYLRGTR